MRPLLRTATLTVSALTALTTVLLTSQSPPYVGSPLASPVTQNPASSQDTPEESLTVAYGLTSNSHGAPTTSAGPLLPTAPDLRPELHSAYWLAINSAPPSCRPTFSLLAAIGQVESGSVVGRRIDGGNRVVPALIGPALDGKDRPAVPDTDAGQLDHDPVWDRAVGPMQLVPVVWRAAAVDMDGDGTRDPQNIYDAAGAAMVYLCAEDRDLSKTRGVKQAVLSYNSTPGYLRLVLAWKAAYDRQQDQTLNLQAVLSTVAPFPTPAQDQLSQGLYSRVLGEPSGPVQSPVLAGAQPSAVIDVQPGPDTGPPTSTPSAPAPSPSTPPTPRPSGPDPTPGPTTEPPAVPTPGPTTEPPAVPTPGPTTEPAVPTPGPTTGPPTPDPKGPAPAPMPEPSPTCVIPPGEVAGVDPSATPTDGTVLCPSEVAPVEAVPAP